MSIVFYVYLCAALGIPCIICFSNVCLSFSLSLHELVPEINPLIDW